MRELDRVKWDASRMPQEKFSPEVRIWCLEYARGYFENPEYAIDYAYDLYMFIKTGELSASLKKVRERNGN